MNSITLKTGRAVAMIAMLLLLAADATYAQMNERLAQAQMENARALRQFEWKSRTEIFKGGESKKVQLSLMRYDMNGDVQKTMLSSTPDEDIPSRGIIGRIAQKKRKDFLQKLESLKGLAQSYGELPPQTMQQFMTNATFTTTANQPEVRIEGRNVLQPGDAMTLFVDPVSRKKRRVEIRTMLEDKPVRIVSLFDEIGHSGPTYMARSEINYDNSEIVIVTENFDYARVQ